VIEKEKEENLTNIGEQYIEAHKKDHGFVELRQLREQVTKDYMENLEIAAMNGKKKYSDEGYHDPFYVVVLMRKERLMKKVIRSGFTFRKTCPTPNYDQTLYKFDPKTDDLSFLWVIPSPEDCSTLYKNRHLITLQKNAMLPYVIDFVEGRLYQMCKHLNGETSKPGYKLKKK